MTAPEFPTAVTDPSSLDYGKTPDQLQSQAVAQANGVQTVTHVRKDYWSSSEIIKHYFPGQEDVPEADKQYIEFKKMTEGDRARYQKKTSKGVVIERATSNARMGIDPAGDRLALIETSVTGWRLFQGNEEVPFSPHRLRSFIDQADPDLVDDLEKAIRKANPWMAAEMGSEEIQKQIDELEDQLKEAKKREDDEKNS